ncbi:MAG: sigma-70 family RNA polymerase sigma factor [Gammaproteobacteria bacterium]
MAGADSAPAQPGATALDSDDLAGAFEAHAAEVRSFLRRRLQCRETAADITQETYLKLIAAPAREPVRDRRAFIFQVARNLAVDYLRLRKRSSTLEAGIKALYEVTEEAQPRPDELVIASEELETLRNALSDLPQLTRAIFVLSRLEGLPRSAAAARLGVSESTVAKHLALALQFLRERLGR